MGCFKPLDVLHVKKIDLKILGLFGLQHLANKALLYLCNTDVSEL